MLVRAQKSVGRRKTEFVDGAKLVEIVKGREPWLLSCALKGWLAFFSFWVTKAVWVGLQPKVDNQEKVGSNGGKLG